MLAKIGIYILKHFKESIIVTILGFIGAYFWAEHIMPGSGPKILFIVFFLSVLEVTLSFDNAVVNAIVLEKMTPKWQHRFITWGILIAVFGMRFFFPVLIVSVFSGLSLLKTVHLAFEDVTQYTYYLHISHAPLVAFGGAFLMMVGLNYFFEENKCFWLKKIEHFMHNIKARNVHVMITILILFATQFFAPQDDKLKIVLAGLVGIVLYIMIRGLCGLLEKKQNVNLSGEVAKGGFMLFLYLELIDASFSLDGVLGSFAISKDIVIITIGLAIGAMFVRSLTLVLVEKKTLKQYVYLASGAHYAIFSLAVVMFISTHYEVKEVITGSIGLICVGASFIASVIENKKKDHSCNIGDKNSSCIKDFNDNLK